MFIPTTQHLMAHTADSEQPIQPVVGYWQTKDQYHAMTINLKGILVPISNVKFYVFERP